MEGDGDMDGDGIPNFRDIDYEITKTGAIVYSFFIGDVCGWIASDIDFDPLTGRLFISSFETDTVQIFAPIALTDTLSLHTAVEHSGSVIKSSYNLRQKYQFFNELIKGGLRQHDAFIIQMD